MTRRAYLPIGLAGGIISAAILGCGSPAGQPAPAPGPSTTQAPRATDVFVRAVMSETFTPKRDPESIRAFRPDVAASDSGGECTLARTGGSGATVVNAGYPDRAHAKMSVNLSFDSAGHLVRYAETRGAIRRSYPGSFTPAQLDSARREATNAVRMTSISMDYGIDQAIVMNRGGGRPTEAILGTVRSIEQTQTLGPPTATLARVRQLCGV